MEDGVLKTRIEKEIKLREEQSGFTMETPSL